MPGKKEIGLVEVITKGLGIDKEKLILEVQDKNGEMEGVYFKLELNDSPPVTKMYEAQKNLSETKLGKIGAYTTLVYSAHHERQMIAQEVEEHGEVGLALQYFSLANRFNLAENFYHACIYVMWPKDIKSESEELELIECGDVCLKENVLEIKVGKTKYSHLKKPPLPTVYADIVTCYLGSLLK